MIKKTNLRKTKKHSHSIKRLFMLSKKIILRFEKLRFEKSFSIAFAFSILIGFSSFSENAIKLSYDNSSWTSVMSGKAVLAPEKTSYGFVVLTDGKTISAYSENGKELWNYNFLNRKNGFISVMQNDFVLFIQNSEISLLNPSGNILWGKNIGFHVTEKPVQGKDGRIIVSGKNEIACLGMNGIEKWRMKTPPLKKMPIQILDDGTFVALLENPSDGKTNGLRFSPFGEAIETITFASIVSASYSCESGILLGFIDGGIGLVQTDGKKGGKGKTLTKWAMPSFDSAFKGANLSKGMRFVKLNGNEIASLMCNDSGKVKAIFFDSETGKIENIFHIPEIDFEKITCESEVYGRNGLFLSDEKNALITDYSGKYVYIANLPEKKSRAFGWNYVFYSGKNHLVITGTNWTLLGFRTVMIIEKKSMDSKAKMKNYSYEEFLNGGKSSVNTYSFFVPNEMTSEERFKLITEGDYGNREIQISLEIFTLCDAYISKLNTAASISRYNDTEDFTKDVSSLEKVFSLLPYFGTNDFSRLIARLLKTEKNDVLLNSLIRIAGICAYDPENAMLDSLSYLAKTVPLKNTTLLVLLSNSVFEICRFMGRPSLYAYGMEIQKTLLYPQYSSEVREAARTNLSKIARLKM